MPPRWSDGEDSLDGHQFSGVPAAAFGTPVILEGAVQIEMFREVARRLLSPQWMSPPGLVVDRNSALARGIIAGGRSESGTSLQ